MAEVTRIAAVPVRILAAGDAEVLIAVFLDRQFVYDATG